MEDEIKFPLDFTKCPNCDSIKRLAGTLLEQERAKGKVGEGARGYVSHQQTLIADPRKALLSAPVLTTYFDVCLDCGTVYCIHATLGTATPQPIKPQGTVPFIFPQKNPRLS